MPATSEKQKKFMDAVAHNKAFATQAGVPQSVGKDFSKASKGLKFGKDRSVATRADRQTINNPKTNQGKQELFKEGGTMATKMNPGFMAMIAKKKAGAKSAMPSKMGKPVMKKGMDTAKDGMKMAGGGMPMVMKDGKKIPSFAADGEGKMKKGGMAGGMHKMPDGKMMKDSAMKKMNMGGMGYAKGGGVEAKGKTKGKMVKMKSGGKIC